MPKFTPSQHGAYGVVGNLATQIGQVLKQAFQTAVPIIDGYGSTQALLGRLMVDPRTGLTTGLGNAYGLAVSNGANWMQVGYPARFQVEQTNTSGPQSIPNNTDTLTVFDTVLEDPYSGWSAGGNYYALPEPGLFAFQVQLAYAANGTGIRRVAINHVGGGTIGAAVVNAATDNQGRCTAVGWYRGATGDQIEVATYQNSGGALALSTAGASQPALLFSGVLLSL